MSNCACGCTYHFDPYSLGRRLGAYASRQKVHGGHNWPDSPDPRKRSEVSPSQTSKRTANAALPTLMGSGRCCSASPFGFHMGVPSAAVPVQTALQVPSGRAGEKRLVVPTARRGMIEQRRATAMLEISFTKAVSFIFRSPLQPIPIIQNAQLASCYSLVRVPR